MHSLCLFIQFLETFVSGPVVLVHEAIDMKLQMSEFSLHALMKLEDSNLFKFMLLIRMGRKLIKVKKGCLRLCLGALICCTECSLFELFSAPD